MFELLPSEVKNIKLKDLGAMRRLVLKAITKIQKILLRSERSMIIDLYYKMARLHFSVYFSGQKDLDAEILNNTEAGYRAAMRHSRLVVNTLFTGSSDERKRIIRYASRGSFIKNIIINAKL